MPAPTSRTSTVHLFVFVAMSPDALLRLVAIARRRASAGRTGNRGVFANANIDVDLLGLRIVLGAFDVPGFLEAERPSHHVHEVFYHVFAPLPQYIMASFIELLDFACNCALAG